MFHPQSRDHSATGNMLELQTDGDRRNVHSGRGIVFGDNFTQILLAATAEHLPDRQTPALFRFHSDLILTFNGSFFQCLLELLLVPWPACPRSPYCMIACQWCICSPLMYVCLVYHPHFYLLKAHRHCLYFVKFVSFWGHASIILFLCIASFPNAFLFLSFCCSAVFVSLSFYVVWDEQDSGLSLSVLYAFWQNSRLIWSWVLPYPPLLR